MSKYQPLTDYLLSNSDKKSVLLTFDSIESLIYPQNLPDSAYIHREWWANDRYHSQAKAWYKAGFLVYAVKDNTVTFVNSDTNINSVVSNCYQPDIKIITCPVCKKQFDIKSINEHIRYDENKHFGNYIRFQSSKFVCGICYGIINNFSSTNLQFHKEKKCINKKVI